MHSNVDAPRDDHLLQDVGVFIVQETVEVSKKVRWGHAHSVLESWTDLALDNAGVDLITSLTGPFFTDLDVQIALISLKGMVSKATIVLFHVIPDWYADHFPVGT